MKVSQYYSLSKGFWRLTFSIIIMLCIFFIQTYERSAIHTLSSIYTNVHLAISEQEQNKYLQQLLQIQSQLKSKTTKLKALASQINDNVTTYSQLPTVQTKMLLDGIKQERELFYDMQSQLALPVDNKKINCRNMTKEQSEKITQQIADVEEKLSELKKKIGAQQSEDCLLMEQLKQEVKFLENYLNHLYQQMSNICEIEAKKFYTMSPDATNFTYGQGKDSQSYTEQVDEYVKNGYLKMQCPDYSPYPYKFERCVACPTNTHYDLSKNMCVGCPSGYYFESSSHICLKSAVNNNPNIGDNYIGTPPEVVTSANTCPNERPYYDGTQCIACESPSYFDFGSNLCKQCLNGLTFLTSSKTCGYEQWNSNPDYAINACCGGLAVDPTLKTCPKSQPYFNGKQCISCVVPSYFDLDSLSCTLCPAGQGFSTKQLKCVDEKYLETGYTSAVGGNVINYKGNPPPPDERYNSIKRCPEEYPYYNSQSCIACSLPSYFNFNTMECQVCPAQTQFNIQSHYCESIKISEKMNSNLGVINNFVGTVPAYDSSLATCPESSPIFDGKKCVSCGLPMYFDFIKHQCETCGGSKSFNTFNRLCEIAVPNFYTDPASDNIYYNGNFKDIEKKIEDQKLQNTSIRACPSDAPFFNAISGSCQVCPDQYPLFDIKYNRCISCTGSSHYNSDKRVCLNSGAVSPTIERMLMNTIGII